jgi:hypothetical protein
VKAGDLVIPWTSCNVYGTMEPTFASRGPSRKWEPDQPAIIFSTGVRNVRGIDVLKFQILLDNELWWTGAGAARLLEPRNPKGGGPNAQS